MQNSALHPAVEQVARLLQEEGDHNAASLARQTFHSAV